MSIPTNAPNYVPSNFSLSVYTNKLGDISPLGSGTPSTCNYFKLYKTNLLNTSFSGDLSDNANNKFNNGFRAVVTGAKTNIHLSFKNYTCDGYSAYPEYSIKANIMFS